MVGGAFVSEGIGPMAHFAKVARLDGHVVVAAYEVKVLRSDIHVGWIKP
jgi:hypothetical protein